MEGKRTTAGAAVVLRVLVWCGSARCACRPTAGATPHQVPPHMHQRLCSAVQALEEGGGPQPVENSRTMAMSSSRSLRSSTDCMLTPVSVVCLKAAEIAAWVVGAVWGGQQRVGHAG